MSDLADQFTECLKIMSHSRAGWDYDLPREQRAKEAREEKEALSKARQIWRDNPNERDALKAAFVLASPLATMAEIEKTP